jgi:hypothetical protein
VCGALFKFIIYRLLNIVFFMKYRRQCLIMCFSLRYFANFSLLVWKMICIYLTQHLLGHSFVGIPLTCVVNLVLFLLYAFNPQFITIFNCFVTGS